MRYIKEDRRLLREVFDLVVLSVGLEVSQEVVELSRCLGVELDEHHFAHTLPFQPMATSRPGTLVCVVFQEPKDIPQAVTKASAAAAGAMEVLSTARHSLAREKPPYPERDVSQEEPRVGVLICHCGTNIAG